MSAAGRLRFYDSHAHLVADDETNYPRTYPFRSGSADQSAFFAGTVGRPGGMHGANPVNEKPTAEQMHGWMVEENVVGIAAVQKGMIYGFDNSYIVDAASRYPDAMRAIVILDPLAPHTPQLLREYSDRGVIGIRFFGVGITDKVAWLGAPATFQVCKLAHELGMLVDIEAPPLGGDALIPVIEGMASTFPDLRIVLDHVFLPDCTQADYGIDDRFDGFAARKNISVKFTSLSMDWVREKGVAPEAMLRRTVDFYGPDRVMWGSDIGTSSGTYREMIERAVDSTKLLTDEERRLVLHDSGRRIMLGWQGDR